MKILLKLLSIFSLININCANNEKILFPFPRFHEQIEEVSVQTTTSEKPDSNLVSFLVQNVKEIFNSAEVPTVLVDREIDEPTTTLEINTISDAETINKAKVLVKINKCHNLSEDMADECAQEIVSSTMIEELTARTELLNLSKDANIFLLPESEGIKLNSLDFYGNQKNQFQAVVLPTSTFNTTAKRSCIFCNNVDVEHCSDPKNKLIPSIVCEQEEDLCYSQHTPFGIVDRGCYNINRNITTYFCSCNLCNYIAISEMPHIFSRKQDWIENVQDMSRLKGLRRSIMKDMSCLQCEVNDTTRSGDIVDSTNCLEGNIGSLTMQLCAKNEICAVKAIRSEGYMWRGCIKKPLFNYWWALCDTDLCNYDALVSVFDNY